MNEIGYHGTNTSHRYSIENEGFDPDKAKRRLDHWLGQGVYFFDDYEKALAWAHDTTRHNGYAAVVYSSEIAAPDDEVLDLDDKHQLDKFVDFVKEKQEEIQNNCIGKMPIFNAKSMRGVFFDYYKNEMGISVIIKTFTKECAPYTQRRNPSELEFQKKLLRLLDVKFLERQICVSNKDCIKKTVMVYNEEEEVI